MNRINRTTIDQLVFNLEKPARYIGGELNQIVKHNSLFKMAICYPDLYEVGMSNNGIQILYQIANSIEDISCERVFAVPVDFENKIRDLGIPLYTLETFTPLYELDYLGFNISHELLYTNILQVLDLGRIPLLRWEREDNCPVIIAGGESVSNPKPMSEFIDVFFLGDGEEGIVDILKAIKISKQKSMTRDQLIDSLSEIEGVYAPSRHQNLHNIDFLEKGKRRIKKRIYRGNPMAPVKPIIPNIRIAQDRAVVEVTKGCKNLCKFCHAGYYELPYRYYDPEDIQERIFKIIKNTGYTDLTLSSLSVSDYKYIVELLNLILPALTERGVSISLPSLKVDRKTLPIIENISDIRRTSLTFAVESGCEEIRKKANKKIKEDDLVKIVEYVFNRGWRRLKLYFMIGLPGCNEFDEAKSIVDLLMKINAIGGRKKDINVTVSPFVPKAHTPFQWEGQKDIEYLEDTIRKIKQNLPRSIKIKNHDPRSSILEGIMSRGDTDLSKVIHASYLDGCRLDSWKEFFNFNTWKKNLDNITPFWTEYLLPRDKAKDLPWDFISTGYEKLILQQRDKIYSNIRPHPENELRGKLNIEAIHNSIEKFKSKYNVRSRIRIRFSKRGKAKFIPHIDFMEIIKRSLRMADIPVSFTQGFNKREKISMGYPLPIGIESRSELCDVDLFEDIHEDFHLKEIKIAVDPGLPEGINVINARNVDKKESIMSITKAVDFIILFQEEDIFKTCVRNLNSKIDFEKKTKKGNRLAPFHDAVINYNITDNKINMKITVGNENSMRIDNIALALAGLSYDEFYKFEIIKTAQYRRTEHKFVEII
ncbi:MAG: TIGR03960 family B12-binding radical SAM protein [Spirochaetota bacterium]|nr:TIGR03960 family B12-binding radical SAM protein [Spirochaetota bacterium]